MRPALLLALLALAGCRATSRFDAAWPEQCRTARGTPADSTLTAGRHDHHGAGLLITTQAPGQFVLTLEGPLARRQLGVGPRPCPVHPEPGDTCTTIERGDWFEELQERVDDLPRRDSLPEVRIDGVSVHDWADLDDAALVVADALRALRLSTAWPVRVTPMTCANVLEGTR